MSKSVNRIKMEAWTLDRGTDRERQVAKVAVRNEKGQFNGATNFRGSVLGE